LGPWKTAAFMDSSFPGQEVADEDAGDGASCQPGSSR
jgi:hypothetical protein